MMAYYLVVAGETDCPTCGIKTDRTMKAADGWIEERCNVCGAVVSLTEAVNRGDEE